MVLHFFTFSNGNITIDNYQQMDGVQKVQKSLYYEAFVHYDLKKFKFSEIFEILDVFEILAILAIDLWDSRDI